MPYLSKYSYLSDPTSRMDFVIEKNKRAYLIITEVRVNISQRSLTFTVYSFFHVLKKMCTIQSFLVYLSIETKNLLQNHTRELLA